MVCGLIERVGCHVKEWVLQRTETRDREGQTTGTQRDTAGTENSGIGRQTREQRDREQGCRAAENTGTETESWVMEGQYDRDRDMEGQEQGQKREMEGLGNREHGHEDTEGQRTRVRDTQGQRGIRAIPDPQTTPTTPGAGELLSILCIPVETWLKPGNEINQLLYPTGQIRASCKCQIDFIEVVPKITVFTYKYSPQ